MEQTGSIKLLIVQSIQRYNSHVTRLGANNATIIYKRDETELQTGLVVGFETCKRHNYILCNKDQCVQQYQ